MKFVCESKPWQVRETNICPTISRQQMGKQDETSASVRFT